MPRFITQTTTELPAILVVGQESEFRPLLIKGLTSQSLRVEVLDPQTYQEWGRAQQQKFLNETDWYKVVWLTGPLFFPLQTPTQLIADLHAFSRNLIILAQVITPIYTESDLVSQWAAATQQQDVMFPYLEQVFPSVRLLLLKDMIDSSGEQYPLNFCLEPIGQELVAVPKISVSPCHPDQVVEQVVNEVFSRQTQSVIITGKEHAISESVLQLQQLARDQEDWSLQQAELNAKTKSLLPQAVLLRTSGRVSVSFSPAAKRVIEQARGVSVTTDLTNLESGEPEVVQTKKPVYPEAVEVVEPINPNLEVGMFKVKNLVAHRAPPIIENRFKKYEQRILDLEKRKKASKVLSQQKKRLQKGFPFGINTHSGEEKTPKELSQASSMKQHIESELQSLVGNRRVNQKVSRLSQKVTKTVKIEKKKTRRSVVFIGSAIGLGVGLFAALLAGVFVLSEQRLERGAYQVFAQAVTEKNQPTQTQLTNLQSSADFLALQIRGYQLILGADTFAIPNKIVTLAKEVSDTYGLFNQVKIAGQDVMMQILGKQPGDIFGGFLTLSGRVEEQYKKLSLVQTQLQGLMDDELNPDRKKVLSDFSLELQSQRKTLATLQQVQQFVPNFLGKEGKKTYLLLLQNNQELRPTGGFLQTAGLLTFENGTVANYQVFDVQSIDTGLNGQVTPPDEIKRLLGQTQWYLRDANWNPNFPDTAKQAEFFVEKGISRPVDGVIGLNLFVLKDLIANVGPIELPEYNEVVTDKNLLEKVEFHSELKLVQPAKNEYLTDVFNHTIQKMIDSSPDKATAAVATLFTSLKSSQMQLYFNDPNQYSIATNLGWTGQIATPQCPVQLGQGNCLMDTIMQVEANIGLNKANAFIQRSIKHVISLAPDQVKHQRTVTFTNTATSNAWPRGTYKNYIRFYVTNEAQLSSIEINGAPVPESTVFTRIEHGKQVFATTVEVPIQKSVTVTLNYVVPRTPTTMMYAFFDQKQSGTGDDPIEVTMTPEKPLRITKVAPQAEVKGSSVSFSAIRDKHTFVGVAVE